MPIIGEMTRNARLAAIHSLFRYAAPRAPEHAAVISQVLAIPPRRRERAIVSYLTPEETDALLAAPPAMTWSGAAAMRSSMSRSREPRPTAPRLFSPRTR